MRMMITDLDGTLKQWEQQYAAEDIATLKELGRRGIIRVIATGRNLYFAKKVVPPDFPIDYLIFSSGAGIVRWHDQRSLLTINIVPERTAALIALLHRQRLNFMIHHEIPDEHFFYFEKNREENTDFHQRIEVYGSFARPLTEATSHFFTASQALIIIPADEKKFNTIAQSISQMNIIRTTSPYSEATIWIEVFPEIVSKGAAIKWLCDKLGIELEQTMSIGNDYNDLDLLKTTASSWVVANAPRSLREVFATCPMVEAAVSYAVWQEIAI